MAHELLAPCPPLALCPRSDGRARYRRRLKTVNTVPEGVIATVGVSGIWARKKWQRAARSASVTCSACPVLWRGFPMRPLLSACRPPASVSPGKQAEYTVKLQRSQVAAEGKALGQTPRGKGSLPQASVKSPDTLANLTSILGLTSTREVCVDPARLAL